MTALGGTPAETAEAAAPAARAEPPRPARQRTFTVELLDTRALPAGDGRIPIAFSSEAPVERVDYATGARYLEVLDHGKDGPDLSYARDGLPFLLDHDLGRQVGLVEDVRIDGDRRLRGYLRLGNHPDAQWLGDDIRAGIRSKVSIGYDPGDAYTTLAPKRKGDLAVRRFTGWRLYEASSVAVPADYSVGVGRSRPDQPAATAASSRIDNMEPTERDTRPQELAVLATEAGMPERAAAWLTAGTSVADARSEVLRALREQAAGRAPIMTGGANPSAAIAARAYAAPQDAPEVAAFMSPDSAAARNATREVAASVGFAPRFGGNFVPLDVRALNRGATTRTLTTTGTTTGAELVPGLQMSFNDRLREDLLAPQLGVRMIPVTGGTALFPVGTADPTVTEIAENPVSGVTATDPALATREARPKAAVVRCALSNHIALASTPEAVQTTMSIMSRALAGHMDGRLFAGPTGGNGPVGALFTTGISVHPLGATGGPIDLDALIDLEKLLIDSHGDAEDVSCLTTSGVARALKTTLDFPTSAAGRPLWTDGRVLGRRAYAAEWMPDSLTKSTGEGLHSCLLYSPTRAGHLACVWQGVEVVVDRLTGADKQLTYLTAAVYYDSVILHPGAVAALRDVDLS